MRHDGVPVHLGKDLVRGIFVAEVNRFLATVEIEGGETGVHVANSGRLRELFLPGAVVWLQPVRSSGRKTAYDLALVEADGVLVSADARLPNALVAEAIARGNFEGMEAPLSIARERGFGESRFDLMVEDALGRRYVEVKSVTLVERGTGLFPDSPTLRGAKHLNTLAEAVEAGHRATVVFVVQRPDASAFAVNEPADPQLAEALRAAVAKGVDALACNCSVSIEEVTLDRRLPMVPYPYLPDCPSVGSERRA